MNQPDIGSLAVPVTAIIMGVGIGMLSIFLNYRKRKEMFMLYHQERMAAIEKGVELPPLPDAFFAEEGRGPRSPHRHLLAGLILLFIGLAIMIALHFEVQGQAAWGLVPAGLGAAFLIYYQKVGKKEALEAEAKTKADQAAPRS